jgi:hypothetical protein
MKEERKEEFNVKEIKYEVVDQIDLVQVRNRWRLL